VGLLLATGNTGEGLNEQDTAAVSTYLSRDAGQTWEEVRVGSHTYDFGDHGSITVMVKNTGYSPNFSSCVANIVLERKALFDFYHFCERMKSINRNFLCSK
jgi:hypothetical protein